jgi:formate-dependent nitrite reductase membrane component NrfD
MPEHFAVPPHWSGYVLAYFFLAGVTGGTYALATMLRLWGAPSDERLARTGFLLAFPVLLACPILLTLDLGRPLRFLHMLVDATPGAGGPILKGASPMSLGTWALAVYGVLALISFLQALARGERRPTRGVLALNVAGAILGLYVASYAGVLLDVSNQPVWSDTWTLGGLFLASGLAGASALLAALARRSETPGAEGRLRRADGFFALLELIWIGLFLVNLGAGGTLSRLFGTASWIVLWLLVALGLVPSLQGLARGRAAGLSGTAAAVVVLVGVLALRAVIVFGAQV